MSEVTVQIMGQCQHRTARAVLVAGAACLFLSMTRCGGRTNDAGPSAARSGGTSNGSGGIEASGASLGDGGSDSERDASSGGTGHSGGVENRTDPPAGAGAPPAMGGNGSAGGGGDCEEVGCSEWEVCVEGECRANEEVRAQAEMVRIAGGTFQMGSESVGFDIPRHERSVETFWMDRTEVTVRSYNYCLEAGACAPPLLEQRRAEDLYLGDKEGYEDYPINFVSPGNAERFCQWMGKRLPTETEWEYAAGGNLGYDYPWGDGEPYCCQSGCTIPAGINADWNGCAVAQFPPLANDLYDMTGGYWELTTGKLCGYSAETADGYAEGCEEEGYILRGNSVGSLALDPIQYREFVLRDDFEFETVGFRCARSI